MIFSNSYKNKNLLKVMFFFDEVYMVVDYPIYFGFPAGHIDDNRALIMGRKITLNVEEKCSLNFN